MPRISTLSVLALSIVCAAAGCGKKDGSSEGAPAPSGVASAQAESKGVLDKLKDAVSTEVSITRKPPTVGEKRKISQEGDMNMNLKMGPKDMAISEKEVTRRSEEVLAIDGENVSKMKVAYEVHSRSSSEGTKTRQTPDTLAGKTFIVEMVKGKVNVTTEDGKPVAGPAKLTLLKEFKQFGKQDKAEAALPKRPLKVGEEVPEMGAALGEAFKESMDADGRSGITLDPIKVVLKRKEGELVVFEATSTARAAKGMMKGLVMPLKVETFVRPGNGRIEKNIVDATMGLSPEEQAKNKNMTLSGTLKQTSSASYP